MDDEQLQREEDDRYRKIDSTLDQLGKDASETGSADDEGAQGQVPEDPSDQ